MTDKTDNSFDNGLCYWSPQVKKIHVNVQSVLCQSGTFDVTGDDPIIEPEE